MSRKKKLRVAFGRLMQETNALSPVPTSLADFERTHLVEGEELLRVVGPREQEVKGYMKNLELSGFAREARRFADADVEIVPLVSAWAISGGPLSRECYDALLERMHASLRRAGDVDAVFLSLHGAMGVSGLPDPETHFARSVKEAAGGRPVAASFDLHGNLTKERVAAIDVLSAYHTNPHRDHAKTAARATRALLRSLTGSAEITTAWRSLPMILGGGSTVDFLPPMLGVYAKVRRVCMKSRVLDASLFSVHPWNDNPALGWSAVVHTDADPALAERLADELASAAWDVRNVKPPPFASADEAIREARAATVARSLGVVVIADVSDVVTAGSVGESTALIGELLEKAGDMSCFASVRDAEVVRAAFERGHDRDLDALVGGKLDPARTRPIRLRARVRSLHAAGPFGRVAVLQCGRLSLCVTEGAPMVMMPSFYTDLGLRIWDADVVVVKNFFPFRMFFLPYARKTIYVKTGGITDLDAAFALAFDGPVHPRDHVDDWRARDRARRGVGERSVRT